MEGILKGLATSSALNYHAKNYFLDFKTSGALSKKNFVFAILSWRYFCTKVKGWPYILSSCDSDATVPSLVSGNLAGTDTPDLVKIK